MKGEYGTATAADVFVGKTIGTENGHVTGTLTLGKRFATGTINSRVTYASPYRLPVLQRLVST